MSVQNFDNTNRGALFVNNQRKSEKSPDYSGTLNVDGVEFSLAGWKRKSQKGTSFLSLKISRKPEIEQRPANAPMRQRDPDPVDVEFDDAVPF